MSEKCKTRVVVRTVMVVGFLVLAAGQSAVAGVNAWTSNGPYGGHVLALAIDPATPSILYAGTSGGGVYKTADGGATWTGSGLAGAFVEVLAIDPATPSTLYAATGRTLCIDGEPGDQRFRITLRYDTVLGGGRAGEAMAIPLAPLGVTAGGLLSFFSLENPEVLVKVLDGCGFNHRFWVFYSAATSVGFTLTVEDTQGGGRRLYANPDLTPASTVTDTDAFATCPL